MSKQNVEQQIGIEQLMNELVEDLKPLAPADGVERYLEHRRKELTSSTLEEYANDLEQFVYYCSQQEVENLNELSGREIDGFQTWLREDSSTEVDTLGRKTMRDKMYLLRNFLSYLESIEGVPSGTAEKVQIPTLGGEDGVRNVRLSEEHIEQVTSHLEKFEYASREHVAWVLFTHTGRRLGGIHSLDIGDAHIDRDDPYLEFRHVPPETSLKNKENSEQLVNISKRVGDIIGDYIKNSRIRIETEFGREPLLTTCHGRISQSTLRRYIYKWTRPCVIGQECPHGKDPDECDAAQNEDDYSKCPTSEAPHALRHTYLTNQRKHNVPADLLSERCDVSQDVLEKHYDERSTEEKRQQRRELWGGNDRGGNQ